MRYHKRYLATLMTIAHNLGTSVITFGSLRELLARAAQFALADVPLERFLPDQVVPCENDEVTRAIADTHDADAFASIRSFTVGELRDWLLSDDGRRVAGK